MHPSITKAIADQRSADMRRAAAAYRLARSANTGAADQTSVTAADRMGVTAADRMGVTAADRAGVTAADRAGVTAADRMGVTAAGSSRRHCVAAVRIDTGRPVRRQRCRPAGPDRLTSADAGSRGRPRCGRACPAPAGRARHGRRQIRLPVRLLAELAGRSDVDQVGTGDASPARTVSSRWHAG